MTVLFRCRVERPLLKKVDAVTQRLGTDTGELFRMFLAEVARTGKVPLHLSVEPGETGLSPWEQRAGTLESFYAESKIW